MTHQTNKSPKTVIEFLKSAFSAMARAVLHQLLSVRLCKKQIAPLGQTRCRGKNLCTAQARLIRSLSIAPTRLKTRLTALTLHQSINIAHSLSAKHAQIPFLDSTPRTRLLRFISHNNFITIFSIAPVLIVCFSANWVSTRR